MQLNGILHGPWKIQKLIMKPQVRSSAVVFFLVVLLVGSFLCTRRLDSINILGNSSTKSTERHPQSTYRKIEVPLNCSAFNTTRSCPTYPTQSDQSPIVSSTGTCPEYFRWIHEDLRPWAYTGITQEMVERAKRTANFRLIILNGKAYVERYQKSFQTRDVFTLWGILQLLRRYPGKIPDLELMFDCADRPVVQAKDYKRPNASAPPPLFSYCSNDKSLNIVFPDWSFWGWAEINIKPWEHLLEDLKESNRRMKWLEREPYAYWKGNPAVAYTRQDLLKCNVSEKNDWNARLYTQDWLKESKEGYKQSNLASQCIHRYKIYIEGSAWSVSEKYILACDSVTLIVTPHYYDFYSRGLKPVQHYWPVKESDKCRSIKYAVDWGNSHKQKAQEMGKAASNFIAEDLKMDYIYDYMFHLLNEYAKLFTYKPSQSPKAVELCAETMACTAEGLEKKFMIESIVKGPADTEPCTMPPPYDPTSLHAVLREKETALEQVNMWEKNHWENQDKQP